MDFCPQVEEDVFAWSHFNSQLMRLLWSQSQLSQSPGKCHMILAQQTRVMIPHSSSHATILLVQRTSDLTAQLDVVDSEYMP
jgi:hypothetical protein